MSIWRAPLLWFGILVIVLTAAALIAPYVIDFNRYKPQIERLGEQLTGRKVTIGGEVAATLFPHPSLRLTDVAIAAADGATTPYLLKIGELRARLSLAALASGRLEVEQVHLIGPQLALERLPGGAYSWRLAPSPALKLPFAPQRIAFAGITAEDGVIRFIDAHRGRVLALRAVRLRVAAPALTGPWRLQAEARHRDTPLVINLSTGRLRPGEPLTLSLSVTPPPKQAGWRITFDGVHEPGPDTPFSGRLRITPQLAQGKQDKAGGRMRYRASAKVETDFEELWLNDIRVDHVSPGRSRETIRGSAHVVLSSLIEGELNLKTALLDLRRAEAAGAAWRAPLAFAGRLLKRLPRDVQLRLALRIGRLRLPATELTQVRAAVMADPDELAVEELRARVPGPAEVRFSGLLLPGANGPLLNGDLAIDSRDARRFASWLWPAAAADIRRHWRGRPGRWTLKGRLDVAPGNLRLTEAEATLDGDATRFDLLLSDKERTIRIRGGRLDPDRYLAPDSANYAALLRRLMRAAPAHLELAADTLRLAGLTFDKPQARLSIGGGRFDIERLFLQARSGAQVSAGGRLVLAGETETGQLRLALKGPDGRAFWPLLRALRGASPALKAPPWLAAMPGIDVRLVLNSASAPRGDRLEATLSGKAAGGTVKGRLTFAGKPDHWPAGQIDLDLVADGIAARLPQALIGRPLLADDTPLTLTLNSRGTPRRALETTLHAAGAGLRLRFAGRLRLVARQGWAGGGRLRLDAERATQAIEATGLAAPANLTAPLRVEAEVAFGKTRIRWRALKGALGDVAFGGELRLEREETPPLLSGQLFSDHLHLPALLRLWLAAGGAGETARLRLGRLPPVALDLRLEGDAMRLPGGMMVRRAALAVTQRDDRLSLRLTGRDLKADLTITPGPDHLAIAGHARAELALPEALRERAGDAPFGGRLVITARGRTRARSWSGLSAALTATGRVEVKEGRLITLTPAAFFTHLRGQQPDELNETHLARLFAPGGATLPPLQAPLAITDGEARIGPLSFSVARIAANLSAIADLRQGRLDITLRLKDTGQPPLPPLRVVWAGPPLALTRQLDADALAQRLRQLAVQRTMAEMRRLELRARELARRQRELEKRIAAQKARRARLDLLILRREQALRAFARQPAARRAAMERPAPPAAKPKPPAPRPAANAPAAAHADKPVKKVAGRARPAPRKRPAPPRKPRHSAQRPQPKPARKAKPKQPDPLQRLRELMRQLIPPANQ
ncbi:MAG TPA: AsmA family protein [Thermopetrobacter sp.]|nr:AsmA family protein [Thermopetrobacter sp.]